MILTFMNDFIYTVAVSYVPLHDKAVEIAKVIKFVNIRKDQKKSSYLNAHETIQKAMYRN